MKSIITAAIAASILASCGGSTTKEPYDLLSQSAFDTTLLGEKVSLYTIKNRNIAAQITNFGARLVTLFVPDKAGDYRDVVWGYESIDAYVRATDQYSGPIVGRFGNRINRGKFALDGTEYQTTINNGVNHLHGGIEGFSTRIWRALQKSDSTVLLSYTSPDMEQGYPGTIEISVLYTATYDGALKLEYLATTDKPTIINPTSHAYFNLSGSATDIGNHMLTINADSFTPTDSTLIPTGEIHSVDGTPMDFRKSTAIGERINEEYEPLKFGGGYDHNWVINPKATVAAELYDPASGIVMDVITDQPGIQFYSGNFMDGIDIGKGGDKHNYRTGVALETQNFPDAPNHSNFPSSRLAPSEKYQQTTIYKFKTR